MACASYSSLRFAFVSPQGLADIWREGKVGGKALEKLGKAWEALGEVAGEDNNNLQNLVMAIYVQAMFARGDFSAATKVLEEARGR